MDLQKHHEHLTQVEHHIAASKTRAADQVALIEQMRKDGQDTTIAARLLQAVWQTIDHMHVRRQLILDTITRKSTPSRS